MRYQLRRMVLNSDKAVSLSQEEFDHASKAIDGLGIAMSLEEKMSLLIDNYIELEDEMMKIALRRMVHPNLEWPAAMDDITLINRRTLNLLASTRLYTDHAKHDAKAIMEQRTGAVEALLTTQYEANIEYRAMEALRNYTQHRSLPIHAVMYPGRRVEEAGQAFFEYSFVPVLRLDRLQADGKVKASVLKELLQMQEDAESTRHGKVPGLDLRPLVRQYVASLTDVHDQIRSLLEQTLLEWDACVSRLVERYTSEYDAGPGLAIVKKTPPNGTEIVKYISTQPTERRQDYAERNSKLSKLKARYVSNKSVGLFHSDR